MEGAEGWQEWDRPNRWRRCMRSPPPLLALHPPHVNSSPREAPEPARLGINETKTHQ